MAFSIAAVGVPVGMMRVKQMARNGSKRLTHIENKIDSRIERMRRLKGK